MSEAAPTEEERAAAAVATAQAHRDKFAAGAEGDSGSAAPAPDPAATPEHVKPDHVPDKYWNKEDGTVNYEAWNKAHAALETQFHQSNKPPADPASEETPSGDKPEGDSEKPSESETKAVLETPAAQAAATEYAEKGELSDDTYTKLEAQGISRDLVDTYIAGQEAKASALTGAAYEPTGGEENYTAMIAWSVDNLTEGEKKAYNAQVSTGDPDVIRSAVANLYSRYSETATKEGERTGGSPPSNDSSTFGSRAEMTAAINKVDDNGRRMYDVDPAYRTEVMRKIGASRRAGTIQF